MKYRPIIFSGESVRAILEGHKTQTRRVLKPQPFDPSYVSGVFADGSVGYVSAGGRSVLCPYGKPGDRLWVRESFVPNYFDDGKPAYRSDWTRTASEYIKPPKWQSPLFMPREYSRLTLEIVTIRVGHVQEITERDAIAEGVKVITVNIPDPEKGFNRGDPLESYSDVYALLWDSLNAKRGYSWASNPWVWVVEFKRVEIGDA